MAAVQRTGAALLISSIRATTNRPYSPLSSVLSLCSSHTKKKNPNLLPLSLFSPPSRASVATFCSCSPSFSSSLSQTSTAEADDAAPPVVALDPIREAADALDIRVGRVIKAWRHPEADSLYVEEVDVGEAEPRTICSGLVNYIPLDLLQDINVVVLANLKPRNMRGIKSNGMLMAASDAAHETVELLKPPEGSVPGERIWFGSEEEKDQQPDAATPNQVQKKKIWETVQPHLKTTDSCVAVLGLHPMRTPAGVVTSPTLKNANIS